MNNFQNPVSQYPSPLVPYNVRAQTRPSLLFSSPSAVAPPTTTLPLTLRRPCARFSSRLLAAMQAPDAVVVDRGGVPRAWVHVALELGAKGNRTVPPGPGKRFKLLADSFFPHARRAGISIVESLQPAPERKSNVASGHRPCFRRGFASGSGQIGSFSEILGLPPALVQIGIPLQDILRISLGSISPRSPGATCKLRYLL